MEACVILESLVFITDILIPELYNLLYYTLCEFIWYCIPEMAAILKNGGHFAQIAWLTLYNKKLSYNAYIYQIGRLYDNLKDYSDLCSYLRY